MSVIKQAMAHLAAGEWQQAHILVQEDRTREGCWAHGIVHLIEGDLDNARYWYGKAGRALPRGALPASEITALEAALKESKP